MQVSYNRSKFLQKIGEIIVIMGGQLELKKGSVDPSCFYTTVKKDLQWNLHKL
jgi:hypothetical protein